MERLSEKFLAELRQKHPTDIGSRYIAAWRKIAKYVKIHGDELTLDSVWTAEQYKKVFISTHCVKSNQFQDCRKAMELWMEFLAQHNVVAPGSSSVVRSILFEDLTEFNDIDGTDGITGVYFRDINHLLDVLEDAVITSDVYDVANLDNAICACILSWYYCTVEEMINLESKDVLEDRVIVSGREIVMPPRVMKVLHRYKESPGAYMEVRGNILYAKYKPSSYLFRSSRVAQATKRSINSCMTRLAQNYDSYQITLTHIRKSRIYHDVFQKECITGEINLKEATHEELSELFGVTINSPTLKSRHLKDYKRYKELLYKK